MAGGNGRPVFLVVRARQKRKAGPSEVGYVTTFCNHKDESPSSGTLSEEGNPTSLAPPLCVSRDRDLMPKEKKNI